MLLIVNAKIITMEGRNYENGYLLCDGSVIQEIGDMADLPKVEATVMDAKGCYAYPGMIDPHCHVGMLEDGVADEGADVNEDTDPVTPQLRAVEGIYYMDKSFEEACRAGVTTCVTGPGSANAIGGVFAAVKTDNRDISKMILKEAVAMKTAFGQNPKFVYGDKKTAPATRMANVALMREALSEAKEYNEKLRKYKADPEEEDKPDYDIKKESLLPVVNGTLPVKSHAHRADDVITALRLAKEFGYDVTIEHGTEGHLIAEYLVAENAKVICGPIISERSKIELRNHTVETPGILANKGVEVAIMTDHPCVPIQYLSLSAMLAVKHGMPHGEALKAITIRAAEFTGIADRVGSLKVGKDADIIITDGDLLDFSTNILYTIVNGKVAYDANC